ncbi:DUF4430 domain-containing protein [Rossellomorea vietnamensis]|uniref:DUF4430 domain-containing protein n=1 Tax=Rossellomorea vietnamensis TaxID=218284 RepID=A0A5D4NU16_9BACI|nr:DUF4430 domain-containing protein [Rossellomorea vietnamensis]TYS17697.1 DUF4430 domain-containing protein [Rossellomorea vietnamensis]
MNKGIMQRWTVLFAVLMLIMGNLAFVQPAANAAALDNAVTIKAIDENGEVVLPLTAVEIEEGETAYDVLQEAGEKNDAEIEATMGEYGAFITGIGGASPTGDAYWSFNINGIGAEVGASTHKAANGDHYLFAITEWPSPSVTAKVSVIGKDGAEMISEESVELMEGASAYGALIQAASKHDLSVQATVDNTFFTYINNIENTELGANDYWSVGVNGSDLNSSIVDYTIQPDDHVQLTLHTYEPPSEPDPEEPGEPEEPADPEPTEPVEEADPITDQVINENIANILSYIKTTNVSVTYGNEWWVWGLANANEEIPSSYVTSVKERVKSVEGNFRNIYDLEKVIMGLSAAGQDASSVEGYDLVEALVSHASLDNPIINMNIYALLAVDSGQYETPEGFREEQVEGILDLELDGGGWSFVGSAPSPDITGMALAALAPYKEQAEVKAAMDRAVTYLSEAQGETGGYNIESNGGDASESISQAIIGLASAGVDPSGEAFTKEGGNLLQHLMKFKQADGGFSHLQDDEASSSMSTQQALLALAAYQNFVNGSGLVYQFDLESGETPEDPEQPETEQPGEAEPEQPETGQPNESDPEQTEQPSDQDDNDEVQKPNDDESAAKTTPVKKTEGKKLPETGTNTMAIMIAGLGLLLIGFILFYLNRKRKTA